MKQIAVPGVVYSILLALGAWATDYFTTGDGGSIPWAAILVAAVPVILKSFTVLSTDGTSKEPAKSASRGIQDETYIYETVEEKTTIQRWLLG